MDHIAVNIGQSEVSSSVTIRELFVVEAHQAQHGGMQIVNMHRVFDGFEAELVGGSMNVSAP